MRIPLLISFLLGLTVIGQIPNRPSNPPTAYNEFGKEKLLSQDDAALVEKELREFEEQTSNAIVVVVVDNLHGMEIEQYADELGEKWGVGLEDKDNGLVLLIKPFGEGKREVTIQVGRGLEGIIPDIVCKDIIENEFLPNMKDGNPRKAIKSTLGILKSLAKKEYNYKKYQKRHDGIKIGGLFVIIIIILIVFFIVRKGGGGSTLGGRGFRGGFWGGMGGFGGGFGSGFGGGGSSGGFGGFGGGSFGGGGASGSW